MKSVAFTPNDAGVFLVAAFACGAVGELHAQARPDPRYQNRQSDCRHDPPPGKPLSVRRTDSGVIQNGYRAERVLTFSADAGNLRGGDIVVCTEYGRVEIADSDDEQVRLQVRMEGLGEGADDPADAAARVIGDTELHTFINESEGRLLVRVWHSTLGFTPAGMQPTYVSVRLQVPNRGSYYIGSTAFHGNVAIRRLTLSGAKILGNIGDKFKGVPGFVGQTELDNVTLAGDVNIDNLGGIPGVRPPVAPELSSLAAPVLVRARVVSTCQLTALTGGNVTVAIPPSPGLAVRALGRSNQGDVNIAIDGGVDGEAPTDPAFRTQRLISTADFESRAVRLTITAASTHGTVNVASIPAAPLRER